MKITIIGGTGLIGSKLVKELLPFDHTIIAASRSSGINTISGEGLKEVVERSDVVVDVSNSSSPDAKAVLDFFRSSTMNLVTAALYARVKHYVAISIVGSDRLSDSPYFSAKIAQEELIKESGIPYSILRSSPFYEYAARIAAAASGDEVRVSPAAFQPVAADEAVAILAAIVLGNPLNAIQETAGPMRMRLFDFVDYYLKNTGDPRRIIKDENAPFFGARLDDLSLMPGKNALLGKIPFEQWFHRQMAVY